jgi:hypothetical protein
VAALTSLGRPVETGSVAGPPLPIKAGLEFPAAGSGGSPSGVADRSRADGPEQGGATRTVELHGPICEATDMLGRAALPPLRRDDLVAIGMAGAYGSSMGGTYNGRPRAPEVAWDGRASRLLRRRGSVAALP